MLGGLLILRDVVRILFIFFFSLLFRYIVLVYVSCDHFAMYCTYILYILMYVFHLPLHVLFIFSLYAYTSYILYAIYYILSNSLELSSLTHFLQIHYIGLIGLIPHIIWAWAANCDPTKLLWVSWTVHKQCVNSAWTLCPLKLKRVHPKKKKKTPNAFLFHLDPNTYLFENLQ